MFGTSRPFIKAQARHQGGLIAAGMLFLQCEVLESELAHKNTGSHKILDTLRSMGLSEDGIDLICVMMRSMEPNSRPTAEMALQHKFVLGH